MTRSNVLTRTIRTLAPILACTAFMVASGLVLGATEAGAQTEEELLSQKTYWQERYRMLLRNRAQLKDNIERSNKNYAQAQRRNYPRGGARQQYQIDAANAEKELAEVEKEIVAIFGEAQRDGALPGWLYEVEDEPIKLAPPTPTPAASATGDDDGDDDGRNPLYQRDDEAR